ncbi:hypothetical protein ACFQPG_08790 [Sphingomonas sp. GCM10030256]|uniref:hypothetical protein n=1 Tax=Sphingomonas sp. GCM10030256 TaxID=3273427 RepID=UPI00361C2132
MDNIASWIWVLIPLAAIGIAPFKMWLRAKERQIDAQSTMAAEKAAQYASHTTELEKRVRVLEQIVTDRGFDTAAQIEALRDRPRVEEIARS